MSNPPRKRIVINLETPRNVPMGRMPPSYDAPNTARRRRWPKVLAFLAVTLIVLVVLAAGGGYFLWQRYQTSPTYSLAVIVDAAQRNDMATFDRLVDSEKIVANVGAQALEKIGSPVGLIPGLTINAPVQALPASVLQPLKDAVRDQLAQEMKKVSGNAPKPFVVLALTLPTLVKITKEPNTNRVAATFPGQPVELTMQQDGQTWKIVGLKDEALVTKLVNDFVTTRPTSPKEKAVEPGKRPRKRQR